MTVTMIRHGETVWQADGRYQGVSDVPLSAEGAAKLRAAERLPARVFVTGLRRTSETAEILFPGVPQTAVPGLEEMDFGAFEGKSYRELDGDPAYQSWVDSGCETACPGGESKESFSRRVCAAFEELMDRNAGQDELALVVHGGTIMAVLERFGRPERAYFDWHCGCGCGFRLDAGDWKTDRILRLEETVDCTGGN